MSRECDAHPEYIIAQSNKQHESENVIPFTNIKVKSIFLVSLYVIIPLNLVIESRSSEGLPEALASNDRCSFRTVSSSAQLFT
jgi:hypothetical protein